MSSLETKPQAEPYPGELMPDPAMLQEIDLNEAELIQRAQLGDIDAFGHLYQDHCTPILRYACRLGGPNEAEDVVSETFTRALRHIASFRGKHGLRPWLYAIARNL